MKRNEYFLLTMDEKNYENQEFESSDENEDMLKGATNKTGMLFSGDSGGGANSVLEEDSMMESVRASEYSYQEG